MEGTNCSPNPVLLEVAETNNWQKDKRPSARKKTGGAPADTTKYTGSHKERFDESGKGKGKSGRENIVDSSGYVSAYKHAGTYDSKMKKS